MKDPFSLATSNRQPVEFTGKQKYLLVGLVILAICLRFYHLGEESFWFDESLSAVFASQPIRIAVQSMLEEGLQHSPLFYMLLRPFMGAGFNESILRSLPALLGVVSIPLIAELGRVVGSSRLGLWAAILLTISPFHIWYSREARMYSLLAFVAIGAMLFFSKVVFHERKLKYWLGLSIFTAIGINSHYFAFFIPLVQFIFILITFRQNYRLLRTWAAAMFLAGLTLIPWAVVLLRWGSFSMTSGTALRPDLEDLAKTFWNFSTGYTVHVSAYILVVLSVFLAVLIHGLRQFSQRNLLLLVWLTVPVGVTFLLSLRLPMYMDRYLMVAFPAFLLLIAFGIDRIQFSFVGRMAAVILIGSMLFGVVQVHQDKSIYNRADWRGLGDYLEKNVHPGQDRIATLYFMDLVPLHFYYQGPVPVEPIISRERDKLPLMPEPGDKRSLWLIIAHVVSSEHQVGHCQDLDVEKLITNTASKEWYNGQQERLVEVKQFNCIRLERYE